MGPICEAAGAGVSSGKTFGGWCSTRAQIALAMGACAGASAFVYAVDPTRHAVYPRCLLFQATGFYCAGCGATRAFYALLHGRVLEAAHDNALFIAALPVLAAVGWLYLAEAWRKNAWPDRRLEPRSLLRSGGVVFLLMVIFMVVRNLRGWPFDWLKPLAG